MTFVMRCYVGATMLTAAGVIAMAPWSRISLLDLIVLAVLAVASAGMSRFEIGARGMSMSVSLVVTLVAVAKLPPSGAAIVGVASGLPLFRKLPPGPAVTNAAVFALIPAAGSGACELLHGRDTGMFLNFPAFLIPFFTAVTVCLVVNGLLVACYQSVSKRAQFWAVWRSDMMRATLPYYTSSALALLIVVLWSDIGPFTVVLVIVPVYTSHWVFSQYSNEQKAYEDTISALVQAVEIKDHYTRGHSERVAKGSELIARRIAMAEDRIAKLRYAGLLHDIGKLGVPTRLLAKPGKLTDEEYAQLCLHPNQGVAVIRDIRFLTDVYDGILYHHERLDGRGYPSGRSGDEIPEFARILGVADAFDAMTSTRSYRAARPVAEAMAELWRGAGTQFDPELVRAFGEALALQEAAGHPWQVTDEPVPTVDPVFAGVAGSAPAFVFEDHDDPMVELEWYPNRIGVGEYLVRENALEGGVGDEDGGALGWETTAESAAAAASAAGRVAAPEPSVPEAAGGQWFVRVERLGRVDRPEETIVDAEIADRADDAGVAGTAGVADAVAMAGKPGAADTLEIVGLVGLARADAPIGAVDAAEQVGAAPTAWPWEPTVPLGDPGVPWESGQSGRSFAESVPERRDARVPDEPLDPPHVPQERWAPLRPPRQEPDVPPVAAEQPSPPSAWRDQFEPAGQYDDGHADNAASGSDHSDIGQYANVYPIRPEALADRLADLSANFHVEHTADFLLDRRVEGPGA